MSFKNEIEAIIEQGEALLNGKEFFVGAVLDRFNAAASKYPQDLTIKLMQKTFSNRFDKEGSLAITCQREVQEVFDEVCNLGNIEVFAETLGDLLLEKRGMQAQERDSAAAEMLRMSHEDSIDIIDESQAEALSGLFGASVNKSKIAKFVEQGKFGTEFELESLGLDRIAVEVGGYDENFVVYSAEANCGSKRVSLVIPAEVKLGTVLLPSTFVSGEEFAELTRENIEAHAASDQAVLGANVVFEALASGKQDELSKMASMYTDENSNYAMSTPTLLLDKVDDEGPAHGEGFDFAKVAMPEDLKCLTEGLIEETLVEAGLSLGRDMVLKAKGTLSSELSSMGIMHGKIKIDSEYPEGIVLATNISGKGGQKTIKVPLEVSGSNIQLPSKFISGTTTADFDEATLQAFSAQSDSGEHLTSMSGNFHLSFSDLYNKALKGAAFGNFVEVEDCLAVIQERFGPSFHKTAFNDLMTLININFSDETESPVDEVERYIQAAAEKIRHKEANIKMSDNLMYLYPKGNSDED